MAHTRNVTRHTMLASEVTIPVANDTMYIVGLKGSARTSKERNELEMKRMIASPDENVLRLRLYCA